MNGWNGFWIMLALLSLGWCSDNHQKISLVEAAIIRLQAHGDAR